MEGQGGVGASVTAIALVVTAQVPTIRTGLGCGAVGSKLAVVRAGVLVVAIRVKSLSSRGSLTWRSTRAWGCWKRNWGRRTSYSP